MDAVDRIETTRFLGGEFLLWMWFCRDVMSGDVPALSLDQLDVSLESQLAFTDPVANHEKVVVRGADPPGSPEAEQALLSGKLPVKACLRLIRDGSEWVCTLDATTLALSSVKLPALSTEQEEERFFERMRLLEQLYDMLGALYGAFIGVRVGPRWGQTLHPAMTAWVGGKLTMTADQCRRLHRQRGSATL